MFYCLASRKKPRALLTHMDHEPAWQLVVYFINRCSLHAIIWFITDKVLEPRLGKWFEHTRCRNCGRVRKSAVTQMKKKGFEARWRGRRHRGCGLCSSFFMDRLHALIDLKQKSAQHSCNLSTSFDCRVCNAFLFCGHCLWHRNRRD